MFDDPSFGLGIDACVMGWSKVFAALAEPRPEALVTHAAAAATAAAKPGSAGTGVGGVDGGGALPGIQGWAITPKSLRSADPVHPILQVSKRAHTRMRAQALVASKGALTRTLLPSSLVRALVFRTDR